MDEHTLVDTSDVQNIPSTPKRINPFTEAFNTDETSPVNETPATDASRTSSQDVEQTTNPNDENNAAVIDVTQFADYASKVSEEHLTQIAESNKLKLEELVNHQKILLESLEHENEKFASNDYFGQMEDIMSKCQTYHTKLLKIKKSMNSITQRTTKLKKQCAKLQEAKAKVLVEEEEVKRKELEREKLLVAQPAFLEPDIKVDDAANG